MRVFVSSTYKDLKECRVKVRDALSSVGHEDVAMEYFSASDTRPLERSLLDIESCDVYLGIFAFRYGSIPKGNLISITEQEYRTARSNGKPCLIFLAGEDATWTPNLMDTDRTRIDKLRDELRENHTVPSFRNCDELVSEVLKALPGVEALATARPDQPAATRDRAKVTLRVAILQQMPVGQKMLDSCARAKPTNLQQEYDAWVNDVTSLLNPEYPDLAVRFQLAPIPEPSTFDYKAEQVTFGHHELWPEIWKKIQILREIERELS